MAELGTDRDRLRRVVLTVLPYPLDPDARVGVEPSKLEPLVAFRILDTRPAEVVEDARDERAGVDRTA